MWMKSCAHMIDTIVKTWSTMIKCESHAYYCLNHFFKLQTIATDDRKVRTHCFLWFVEIAVYQQTLTRKVVNRTHVQVY